MASSLGLSSLGLDKSLDPNLDFDPKPGNQEICVVLIIVMRMCVSTFLNIFNVLQHFQLLQIDHFVSKRCTQQSTSTRKHKERLARRCSPAPIGSNIPIKFTRKRIRMYPAAFFNLRSVSGSWELGPIGAAYTTSLAWCKGRGRLGTGSSAPFTNLSLLGYVRAGQPTSQQGSPSASHVSRGRSQSPR